MCGKRRVRLVTDIQSSDDLLHRADRIPYLCVLRPALCYELEQMSKPDVLCKLSKRFGTNIICNVRFCIG